MPIVFTEWFWQRKWSGNGTSWGLAGRKLSGNTKKVQDCNE